MLLAVIVGIYLSMKQSPHWGRAEGVAALKKKKSIFGALSLFRAAVCSHFEVKVSYVVQVWRTLACPEVELLQGTRIDPSHSCVV